MSNDRYASLKFLSSSYLKILLNHSQCISIISNLNFQFGENAKYFFELNKIPTGFSKLQESTIQCLESKNLKKLESKTKNILGENIPYIYINGLIILCFPFFILIGLFIITFLINNYYHKSTQLKKNASKNFFFTIGIVFNFFQSSILSNLTKFLHCEEFENKRFLSEYLIEECSIKNILYFFNLVIFVIPGIFFYGILIPLLYLVYMFKNRDGLYSKTMRVKFGYLIAGFGRNKFYWYIKKFLIYFVILKKNF